MVRSPNFDKVNDYYERGLWGIDRVQSAVGKWITADEFKEITNKPFDKEE